ncbi:MAG: hypothetical protein AMJ65_00775 [Phycisphaerae bacterium SG8_4]|nr:MAG: hypothetical protein AMJ65_00775 [Phycisphaerae bacterium SG8_4]
MAGYCDFLWDVNLRIFDGEQNDKYFGSTAVFRRQDLPQLRKIFPPQNFDKKCSRPPRPGLIGC